MSRFISLSSTRSIFAITLRLLSHCKRTHTGMLICTTRRFCESPKNRSLMVAALLLRDASTGSVACCSVLHQVWRLFPYSVGYQAARFAKKLLGMVSAFLQHDPHLPVQKSALLLRKIFCGHHHYRYFAPLGIILQLLHKLESVHFGHHQIQ